MNTFVNIDTITKEYAATLLKNSLDGLYVLRDSMSPMSAEDSQRIADAIQTVTALRDYLTHEYGLPRWVDVWGQQRRWEHPAI